MYLIAPYPFKGTLTSRGAADAIAAGLRSADPHAVVELLPLGDGGSGTLDALSVALGGEILAAPCRDALGGMRSSRWGMTHDGVAIVEAAEVIPLADVPLEHRDPSRLSTAGLGGLITTAFERHPARLIIGLGDTATHDCGLGVGAALGYRFLDERGMELDPVGASLIELHAIDRAGALRPSCKIVVYCDVLNPLLGPDGAARRFASQKGATPGMVEMLEQGGERFAEVVARDIGRDISPIPGAGAAGGLGAGLAAFCGATLTGGADGVLDAIGFDERARRSDLVITGEGRLDGKTLLGKGVGNVARRTRESGEKLLVIVGAIEGDRAEWERALGGTVLVLGGDGGDAADTLKRVVEGYGRGRR